MNRSRERKGFWRVVRFTGAVLVAIAGLPLIVQAIEATEPAVPSFHTAVATSPAAGSAVIEPDEDSDAWLEPDDLTDDEIDAVMFAAMAGEDEEDSDAAGECWVEDW